MTAVQSLETSMRDYAWFTPSANLKRMGLQPPKQVQTVSSAITHHLTALMEYPPLAILANGLLAATNELGKCAPLSIAVAVGSTAEKYLEQALQKIKNTQSTSNTAGTPSNSSSSSLGDSANLTGGANSTSTSAADPLVQFSHGVHDHLLPLMDALLHHVYPTMAGLFNLTRLQSSLDVIFEEERLEAEAAATRARQQQEEAAAEDERRKKKQKEDEDEKQRREEQSKMDEADPSNEQPIVESEPSTTSLSSSAPTEVNGVTETATTNNESADIDIDIDAALEEPTTNSL